MMRRLLRSPWTSTTLLVLVLLLGSLNLWGLRFIGDHLDYQGAASWGAVVAAVATAATMIVYLVTFLHQQSEIERRLSAEKDRQTTSLFAWVGPVDTMGIRGWTLYFRNETNAPIYTWSVALDEGGRQERLENETAIRPGDSSMILTNRIPWAKEPRVELKFTDREDRTWVRAPNGTLKMVGG